MLRDYLNSIPPTVDQLTLAQSFLLCPRCGLATFYLRFVSPNFLLFCHYPYVPGTQLPYTTACVLDYHKSVAAISN